MPSLELSVAVNICYFTWFIGPIYGFTFCTWQDTGNARSRRAIECCRDQDYCNRRLHPTLPPLMPSGETDFHTLPRFIAMWPRCGAGGKRHMVVCVWLGLFSHPLMKRTASPRGLLEFLASGGMWICVHLSLCNKRFFCFAICHTLTFFYHSHICVYFVDRFGSNSVHYCLLSAIIGLLLLCVCACVCVIDRNSAERLEPQSCVRPWGVSVAMSVWHLICGIQEGDVIDHTLGAGGAVLG